MNEGGGMGETLNLLLLFLINAILVGWDVIYRDSVWLFRWKLSTVTKTLVYSKIRRTIKFKW